MSEHNISDPWSEKEGERFWAGYEEFLDRVSMIGDDEKTVCMEVGSF